jgi:hypothetical protein
VINIERLTIAEEDLDESSVTKVTVQKIRLLHICLCCREFAKINSNDAKKKTTFRIYVHGVDFEYLVCAF